MFNKREIIEIVYRPQPVPEEMMDALITLWMHYTPDEIVREFNKSTKLNLVYMDQGLFTIKY